MVPDAKKLTEKIQKTLLKGGLASVGISWILRR
jgi:hypothetical protein